MSKHERETENDSGKGNQGSYCVGAIEDEEAYERQNYERDRNEDRIELRYSRSHILKTTFRKEHSANDDENSL